MFVLVLQSVARRLFSLGIYLATITKISAPVQIHPRELKQTFNTIFCTDPPKITVKAEGRSYCCLQPPHGKVQQRARLFSKVHGYKTRGNRHNLEHKKFWLEIRKKHFHHEGGQMLDQGSKEASGMTILGGIQLSAEQGPEQPDLGWAGVGQDDLQRSLHPKLFWTCVILFDLSYNMQNCYLPLIFASYAWAHLQRCEALVWQHQGKG